MVFAVLALIQGGYRIWAYAGTNTPSGATSEQAAILAVTFESQWCGPCKILKPKFSKARAQTPNLPIRYVTLDFTFRAQSEYDDLARKEGFLSVYNSYKSATGFVVLVDPVTGDTLDVITADYSAKAITRALARAVTLSEREPPLS